MAPKAAPILSSLRAIWRRRCLNSGAFCIDLRVHRNFYRCKGGRGIPLDTTTKGYGLAGRGTSKPASDCCVYIPPSSHRMKEVRDKVVNRSYGARLGDRCECRCCGWLFRKRKSASSFFILPTVFISPLSHRLRKFHDRAAHVCTEPPRASRKTDEMRVHGSGIPVRSIPIKGDQHQ